MSEIVRALLADNCAHKRLMVRQAQVTSSTQPEIGTFRFQYPGAGIFYPQAVYSTGFLPGSGQVLKGQQFFTLSLHDQHDAIIINIDAFGETGNLNSYYDNLDCGNGLVSNQYFILHYEAFTAPMTICAVFVGTEFLFDQDLDLSKVLPQHETA